MDEEIIEFDMELTEDFPQITEVTVIAEPPPRPSMTTPLNDYTVSEGLLLLILVYAVIAAIYNMIRRFVYWLK